ncbi:MAG: calcium-binding protein [Novosphingobium sp.]
MTVPNHKITGTALDNTLIGTGADDAIYGLGGRDILTGGEGDDLLDGGTGGDRMAGGLGDDTYIVDSISDRVTELRGAGIDSVETGLFAYSLRLNVENLTFTSSGRHIGFGNNLANMITGNAGNDRLTGKAGDDSLSGGAGVDSLYGGTGNDRLSGGTGADKLYGGAGNDVLDGGSSADLMVGGAGNDTYVVDSVGDRLREGPKAGTDTVQSSVTFKLGANIENLVLTGSDPIRGTGNALDNVLTGNEEANTLRGLAGNDTLGGGAGLDTLTGGIGGDKFVFSTKPSSIGNFDTITDFSHFEGDKIVLSATIYAEFDQLTRIDADSFYAAPGATKAKSDGQFLIYNSTTGALYYDAGGPDGANPVKIAELGTNDHPDLAFNDFLIIA